jgi:hypothetical protein
MLSAGTVMHLKQKLFPLVIFNNYYGTIHILEIIYIQCQFLDTFSCLSYVFHTALTCVLAF